jgi:hypothetical protein
MFQYLSIPYIILTIIKIIDWDKFMPKLLKYTYLLIPTRIESKTIKQINKKMAQKYADNNTRKDFKN